MSDWTLWSAGRTFRAARGIQGLASRVQGPLDALEDTQSYPRYAPLCCIVGDAPGTIIPFFGLCQYLCARALRYHEETPLRTRYGRPAREIDVCSRSRESITLEGR